MNGKLRYTYTFQMRPAAGSAPLDDRCSKWLVPGRGALQGGRSRSFACVFRLRLTGLGKRDEAGLGNYSRGFIKGLGVGGSGSFDIGWTRPTGHVREVGPVAFDCNCRLCSALNGPSPEKHLQDPYLGLMLADF